MSWSNYGKWQLDHIKPLAALTKETSEEDARALNHYSNFQPLWAEDNAKKGSWWNGERL